MKARALFSAAQKFPLHLEFNLQLFEWRRRCKCVSVFFPNILAQSSFPALFKTFFAINHKFVFRGHAFSLQFSDKSSGVWERSLFFQPPLLFRIFCQSCSGGVSKTNSSEAGKVSHDLRFISVSNWPGDQPA